MRNLFLLVTCFVLTSVSAQTVVNSNISSNVTWTLTGSPYIVTINLVVFQGYSLTVDPGVEVRFDDGTELDLRGRLVAIGTPNDSITFTSSSANPANGMWDGIRVTGLQNPIQPNQVEMKYCIGLYADRFIDLDLAYEGPYTFEHCTFKHNSTVNYDGGQGGTYFTDCDFMYNTIGIQWDQFGGRAFRCRFLYNHNAIDGFSRVDSCLIRGNTGIAFSPYGSAVGNTIDSNAIGVRCYFNSVNDSLIGNTVTQNDIGVEIQSYFNSSIHFHHNYICDNSIYDIKMATSSSANLGNNCWCAKGNPDPQKIYDGLDDPNQGLVTVNPVITNCGDSWVDVGPTLIPSALLTIATLSPGVFSVNTSINDAVCEVYSVNGQLISTTTFTNPQNNIVDLQNEAAGMYVIRIVSGEEQWVEKVVVDQH